MQSPIALLAGFLTLTAILPPPAQAQVNVGVFAGSGAGAHGDLDNGLIYDVYGIAGPIVLIGGKLVGGYGFMHVCNMFSSDPCDHGEGEIPAGSVNVDPTLTMAQMSFCVPSETDASKELCVTDVTMTGTGDPGIDITGIYPGSNLPPICRSAEVTAGTVRSDLLATGDVAIVTPSAGSLCHGVTIGIGIE